MKLEFAGRHDGHSIVGGLQLLSKSFGARFEHTPVSISFSGSPENERRQYAGLRLTLDDRTTEVLGPEGYRSLDRGREYKSIILEGPLATEIEEGLEQMILEFKASPPKPPSVEGNGSEYLAEPRDLSGGMRVLVVWQGEYGERILSWLTNTAPEDWEIEDITITTDLPEVIDDPAPFLPKDLPQADLVLFLSEFRNAPQLAPDLVRRSNAVAIIAPVDRTEWMPPGQVTQLKRVFSRWRVDTSFPRPFCALEGTGAEAIDLFASRFGVPKVEIITEDGRTVSEMRIIRGSPCGCTRYVAENIVGERLEDAVERAGLLHHHFPCLASMEREDDLDDTLMHVSGLLLKREVERGVRKHLARKVSYIDPRQFMRR